MIRVKKGGHKRTQSKKKNFLIGWNRWNNENWDRQTRASAVEIIKSKWHSNGAHMPHDETSFCIECFRIVSSGQQPTKIGTEII